MNDKTQQATVEHSQTPWRMVPSRDTGQEIVTADNGHHIAVMIDYNSFRNTQKKDRDLILRAVNCHDDLLGVLDRAKMCIESLGSQLEGHHTPTWDYSRTLEAIETMIAKAK